MANYILAFDQGTTSSRTFIYNEQGEVVAGAQKEFKQSYPKPGWVEHDPEEIWNTQLEVSRKAIEKAGIQPSEIAAIGITNQRETTVVWNRETGKPVYPAIVWQDRRTAEYCESIGTKETRSLLKQKTGLLPDAYFSGTKIRWILENVEGARELAQNGKLAFGTIDSWLIWKLSEGASHITDTSNASRTLLFNIHTLSWDEELLELFSIPVSMLPNVVDSSGNLAVCNSKLFGASIPITGIAGDQQSALFGQLCHAPGMLKNTYGTGCFLMLNTGEKPVESNHQLLTTIAWTINGKTQYALEGSVFVGGAVIQWLRDSLDILNNAQISEEMALEVEDNGGVFFVPALTGMGAPYWDPHARGSIFGLTRGTTKNHLVRAALESIAFQVDDLLKTMVADTGTPIQTLRVDGGAAVNKFLVQFQSDISNLNVERPENLETTALGAAYLAGIGSGLWSLENLNSKWELGKRMEPTMNDDVRKPLLKQWKKAVERTLGWE